MKKIIGLFLAMAAAGSVWADTEGTVKVPVLNARQEPTVKAPVMMRLKEGQKVNIIRRCGENWLEIAAPSDAPVYVDESLAVGGKAHRNIRMYSGKGRSFPVWGELQKGEKIELKEDRGYGWVRIAPPERLRVYVVALYVDGADAVKSESDAEAKPEAKAEEKTEAKPEAKAEDKSEAKPEAKAEDKPEAKPEAKPEEKTEAKPEAKPALQPFAPDAALVELGIKPTDKGQLVERTGIVIESTGDSKAASFMLKGDRGEMLGFIYCPGRPTELKKLISERVTVRGTEFPVKGWKKPVIAVQEIEKAR